MLKGMIWWEAELNSNYKGMIKSISEKLTDVCKEEKIIWNSLEDVVERYDELSEQVEVRK